MASRTLGQCLVCDDSAVGINFAVPTCAACKAFFRRNAVKLGVCNKEMFLIIFCFYIFRDVILFVNKMVIVQ